MAKLTNDTLRTYETQDDSNALPVAAGTKIFGGALVGCTDTGYARPLQAGDKAVGFAKDGVDNTAGADGDTSVELKTRGKVCLDMPGISIADVGKNVYASDDDTFTLTATSNSLVGKLVRVAEPEKGVVAFDFLFNPETETTTSTNLEG